MEKTITINSYNPEYQEGINTMMQGIEKEFLISITSPQSTKINEVYQQHDQQFWVALHDEKIVGTIGLSLFANQNAVLKRMMVDKDYRGKEYATAHLLLNTSTDWAIHHGFKTLYLGTMDQFKAAQKFYTNKGFIAITKEKLPKEYHPNPIDTLYYKLEL